MSAAPARQPRPIPQPTKTAPPRPGAARATAARSTAAHSTAAQSHAAQSHAARTAPGRRATPAPASAPRPHLRAVAAPEQARSLVPFAWLCAIIVVSSLAAVLLLNTSMASGAYERRDLKIEIANLHEQRATLVTQLEQQSAPEQLGRDARALGMQPAERFGFISLADTVVIESGSK